MKRQQLETLAINLVKKNSNEKLTNEQNDMLISIATEALTLGYQLAYGELLESTSKKIEDLTGIKNVKD